MGQRAAWTWGVWLGLVALGCGGAPGVPEQPEPPTLPAPIAPPEPAKPDEPDEPKPAPLVCKGHAAVAPEPGSADPGACRETVQEGDGRTRARTERRFDAAGRLLSSESYGPDGALGAFERRTYDSMGRLRSRATPEGRSAWSLDACGRPERLEETWPDGRSQVTLYRYDAQGQRVESARTLLGEAQGPFTEQVLSTYDAEGRVVREETRSARGSLDAWLQVDTYAWDAQGRMTEHTRTRSGSGYDKPTETWTRLTYDAGGRLVLTRSRSEGGDVTRVEQLYDGQGRLRVVERTEEPASGGSGSSPGSAPPGTRERRNYDAQGRLVEVVNEEFGPDLFSQENRWACTWRADGGRTETYRDRDGSVDGWEREYDARGLLVRWKTENFLHAVFSNGTLLYGAQDQLLRSETQRGTSGHSWKYVEVHAYDAAGRLSLTDAQSIAEGASGVTYSHTERALTYDAAGHVTLQEDWDLASGARVLLLRTQAEFSCGG